MTGGPERDALEQLVVVGASAGGIEAVGTLVSTLSADLPAALIIAQHIDPSRISHLPEILQRKTALRVKSVVEPEPLRPGVVYIVPADRNVSVTDHEVRLSEDSSGRPKPSANLLFSSAADVFGERLIAVILSGTGSDGALGAEAVKRAGGTVIIQNPATARYPSMPRSLAPGVVDIVAELDDLGSIVARLVAGEYVARATPEPDTGLQVFLEELRIRRGIDFNGYKPSTIRRRLERRWVAVGASNLEEYQRYLDAHPDEMNELVRAFLIKVTEFFRDKELFTYLREQLVPQLILSCRAHGAELRAWSAGCATGQEAYSLAILIAEALGNDLENFGVRVFATDLDAAAVAFARRGVYPRSAVEQLPPDLVSRYFVHVDGEFEITKRIRAIVIFGEHDLGQRAPFPSIDLILCRNVLMYFTAELQKRILQLFAFSLREEGTLVLGKAESITPLPEFFASADARLHVYRRRGDRSLIPALLGGGAARSLAARQVAAPEVAANPERGPAEVRAPAAAIAALPFGVVIVDRRYDVHEINETAQRLLGIHVPAEGEDLVHLVRGIDAARLRSAIDEAFSTGEAAQTGALAVDDAVSGTRRYLDITCHPGRAAADQADRLVVIVVSDITASAARQHSERAGAEQRVDEAAMLNARLTEVIKLNAELAAANDALLATNREHASARQRLAVDNAAVQASAEEVETLNEELHATNEELETLNEEAQSTVEELNATNDDLTARTYELERLSHEHDTQRRQLAGMLESIGDAVLVLNERGQVTLTNAAYTHLFDGAGGAFVSEHPDGELVPLVDTVQERARRGETFNTEFTAVARDGTRRWLEATVRPIETDDGALSIIAIRDISERTLRRLQEQFLAAASHELRTPLTALHGYLQLIQRELARPLDVERMGHRFEIAFGELRRLERLIDELLDAERLRSGRMPLNRRRMDLADVLRVVVEAAQPLTRGQVIELSLGGGELVIEGDADRLEQVFLNLLSNAIAYAPDTARIEVHARQHAGQVEVAVRDYGPGLPAAELTRVFDQFYRVENNGRVDGLGLGLFIVAQIVKGHGGTTDAASEPGAGTTFTVRLPRAPAEPN